MLIKLIVLFAVFCALLYLLNKAMPEFQIEMGAIPVAALILVGVYYGVNIAFDATNGLAAILTLGLWVIIKKVINFLTFGLFGLIIGFVINVVVFWLADKFTDKITIKSGKTLLISAAALQFATYLVGKFI